MASAELAVGRSVRRFGRTERALHWLSAGAFGVLMVTGLVLWLPFLATAVNDRPLMKAVHLWAAVVLGAGVVGIVLTGDRRALARTARDVDRFDRQDRAWLRGAPKRIVRGGDAPPAGRFNAGQKLNVVIVAAAWILFGVSGTFLWLGERDHTYQLGGMLFLHDVLTLVMLVVVLGHIYMAALNPRTSGGLRGMTRGTVDRNWARRHHPRWDPDSESESETAG
jgi:formate dehydrogenase subunit gamma